MKRLLKKEIETISTLVLNMRYCRILERGETMDAKDIPVADAKEILWIEDELRRRLIKVVGHDFYPPDRIEELMSLRTFLSDERKLPNTKTLVPSRSSSIKALVEPAELKPKQGIKIKFNIVVTSSIGSKAAEFKIEADSKSEADIIARKMIRKLGLQGTTYKLS